MISRKGGAGKTNLAVHLAACAEGRGIPTGVVDSILRERPPNGTANRNRTHAGAKSSQQPASLPKLLETGRRSGAELMISTLRRMQNSLSVDAARASSFILIPCRPAIADLEAIPASADIARLAKRPFAVVLNAVGAQGAGKGSSSGTTAVGPRPGSCRARASRCLRRCDDTWRRRDGAPAW